MDIKELKKIINNSSESVLFIKENEEITKFNGDAVNVCKVNGRTISLESLPNGVYCLFRGNDWVFGNDGSLLYSKRINQGGTEHYSESYTKTTSIQRNSSTSVTFDFNYIKLAVTQAFNKTITDSVTKTITVDLDSPSGDTYYKIYATYTRYDVVRVKNNMVIDNGSLFEFIGSYTLKKNVAAGEEINQSELFIEETKCMTTEVDNIIWEIMDKDNLTTGQSQNNPNEIFDLNNNLIGSSLIYRSPNCKALNFIFKISEAGRFVMIGSSVTMLTLYNYDVNANNQISRLETVNSDGVNSTYIQRYMQAGVYMLKVESTLDIEGSFEILFQKQ
ncbi:MAG: enterotoxin [Clostridium sp.]|uniref:enterotoxin n=1 Tax=Clostridium sp. TaxID=1506 RepID=UPI00399B7240